MGCDGVGTPIDNYEIGRQSAFARRSPRPVGEGASERGAGTRLRDATAKAHISTLYPLLAPAAGDGGAWSRDRRNAEQGPACGMRSWNRPMRVTPSLARLRG